MFKFKYLLVVSTSVILLNACGFPSPSNNSSEGTAANLTPAQVTNGTSAAVTSGTSSSTPTASTSAPTTTTGSSSSSSTSGSASGSSNSTSSSLTTGSSSTSGGTSGTSSSTPPATATPTGPYMTISCNQQGQSITCNVLSSSGEVATGAWIMSGAPVTGCNSPTSCTISNMGPGNYTIQAAVTVAALGGMLTYSSPFTISVQASSTASGTTATGSTSGGSSGTSSSTPYITISCPASAQAGTSVTCTATDSGGFASGHWTTNGTQFTACNNDTSCTDANVPAGTYVVQAFGTEPNGQVIQSNTVTVNVLTPAQIAGSLANTLGTAAGQALTNGVASASNGNPSCTTYFVWSTASSSCVLGPIATALLLEE